MDMSGIWYYGQLTKAVYLDIYGSFRKTLTRLNSRILSICLVLFVVLGLIVCLGLPTSAQGEGNLTLNVSGGAP